MNALTHNSPGWLRAMYLSALQARLVAGLAALLPVLALAAANAELKAGWKLDGANLLPLLQGESTALPHPEGLFWRFGDQWAVGLGDWKMVQAGSRKLGPVALYRVNKDIGEKTNLLAQQPEKERELRAAWERWNQDNLPARWALKE
jgi:hypothetical protein